MILKNCFETQHLKFCCIYIKVTNMENILPRKYNNPIFIGLAVALAAAIGVILYMWYQKPTALPPQRPHVVHHKPQAPPPQDSDTFVGDASKPTLVLFWGQQCGHSVKMMPDWEKVSNILNNSGTFEAIDFESQRDPQIMSEAQQKLQNFRGIPDIRMFPQGFGFDKPCVQYGGPRTEEAILKFVYTGGK